MTAAGKLAGRHTLAELVRLEAALTADPANRLPDGHLRPSAVRRLTNVRWAMRKLTARRKTV